MRMRTLAIAGLIIAMTSACSSELNKQSLKVTQVKQQQTSSYSPNVADVKGIATGYARKPAR